MAEEITCREIRSGKRFPVIIELKSFSPLPSGRRGKLLRLLISDYGLNVKEPIVKFLYTPPALWCSSVSKELGDLVPEFHFSLEATELVIGKQIYPAGKEDVK